MPMPPCSAARGGAGGSGVVEFVGLGLLWVGLWAASDDVYVVFIMVIMGWCVKFLCYGLDCIASDGVFRIWFGLVCGLHQMVSLCLHQMVSAGLTLTSSGLLWVGLWAASDGVFGAVLGWSVGCIRWCLCVCILEFSFCLLFFRWCLLALLLALFWGCFGLVCEISLLFVFEILGLSLTYCSCLSVLFFFFVVAAGQMA
ncbi:hypothetical protein LOK49_LG02G00548 [Camellia lanceoleosa]|uniref:Uncharacterized protein n=1 Tax=Camellia lanceoleosa TaxID=1840588 RepID=A0ACC0IQ00_9ERIC|nr:hypothetical protein LOK49_LG02G00548 [Camellia lanceoleosa]